MSESLIQVSRLGQAFVVTLNRPNKRNALSRDLISAISEAVENASTDSSVRSVILTGAGPAFCAGMDLAELSATVGSPGETDVVWTDAHRLASLFERIYTLPKPTIAAVNGPAMAGGAGLVTVCDLAIAVPSARFGYPEVRRGLVAAMVMPHLLRHVGERLARYLLLTGESIDAATAERMGLINAVVDTDALMDRAAALAAALAEGGPRALAVTKNLLQRFTPRTLSLDEAARASAEPRLGEECRLGTARVFREATGSVVCRRFHS